MGKDSQRSIKENKPLMEVKRIQSWRNLAADFTRRQRRKKKRGSSYKREDWAGNFKENQKIFSKILECLRHQGWVRFLEPRSKGRWVHRSHHERTPLSKE